MNSKLLFHEIAYQDHLQKAKQNFDFYVELCNLTKDDPNRFADWKVTVLFYTAAHMIRAYIALNSVKYSHFYEVIKHSHCKELIEKGSTQIVISSQKISRTYTYGIPVIEIEVSKAYKALKDLSERARYTDQISQKPKIVSGDVEHARQLLDDILKILDTEYQIKMPS